MQSSIYIRSNDMSQIINECHNQASYFRDKGFVVFASKIEAMAYGNIGIPINSEELINYEDNEFAKSPYFEFHIKCKFLHETDNEPITIENIELLKQCSNNITLNTTPLALYLTTLIVTNMVMIVLVTNGFLT